VHGARPDMPTSVCLCDCCPSFLPMEKDWQLGNAAEHS